MVYFVHGLGPWLHKAMVHGFDVGSPKTSSSMVLPHPWYSYAKGAILGARFGGSRWSSAL
jgi:hypothetical protein